MVDVEVSDLIERFANGVMISQSDQLAVIKVTGYTTGELCHIDGRSNGFACVVSLDRKRANVEHAEVEIVTVQANVEAYIMAQAPKSTGALELSVHINNVMMPGLSTARLKARPWPCNKSQPDQQSLTQFLEELQPFVQSFKRVERKKIATIGATD